MRRTILALCALLCLLNGRQTQAAVPERRYEVALCAIFHDEARYLKEWIEYHRLVGVDHFFLYDNLSVDDWRAVLDPYIDAGIVEVKAWPYSSPHVVGWNEIQCGAYNDCLSGCRETVHWLACLDVDEFIVLKKDQGLRRWLRRYRAYGAVALNWQMFGTGGVARVPDDKLLIETLLWKASAHHDVNRHIKCVVQPTRVRHYHNPHFAVMLKPWQCVDTNRQAVSWAISQGVLTDKAVVHHYWTRDIDYLVNVKMARRRHWGDGGKLEKYMTIYQDERDEHMLSYVDRLREAMNSAITSGEQR